ncbi:hypothetical protein [Serratia oryzae]|nr:hypothetical protein [Serratia oryzae]
MNKIKLIIADCGSGKINSISSNFVISKNNSRTLNVIIEDFKESKKLEKK